jgi:hypothetical protein
MGRDESEGGRIVLESLFAVVCLSVVPQEPWVPNPVSIQVTSIVTGKPVAEAFVLITGDTVPGSTSAVAGEDGWTRFPELVPQPDVNGEPVPTAVTVHVERAGYLPLHKRVSYTDGQRMLSCPLVPTDTGYNTPMIRAQAGGRFHLQGLGALRVAAGALSYDVSLRLIPIPDGSWTNAMSLDGMPRYQLWVAAYDVSGSLAQGAVPAQPGAITLEVGMPWPYIVPEDATGVVWTTHCLGDSFAQDLTCVAQEVRQDQVMMPVGAGHNVLCQTYQVAETTCGGMASEWSIDVVFMGVRSRVIATIPVLCGVFTASGGCGVKAGEEISSTLTWKEEEHRKYGVTGATAIGRVNAEFGFNSSYSEETGTVTTKSREGNVSQTHGTTVSGRPMGQQGGGYDCVTGDCHFGEVFHKFGVWAKRRWVCPDGGIQHENIKVAEVEVFVGVQTWYEVHWDGSCPGCAQTGDVPSLPQPH